MTLKIGAWCTDSIHHFETQLVHQTGKLNGLTVSPIPKEFSELKSWKSGIKGST